MDFLTLISGMEYKLLSARNVEILKSVYTVQDENILLLKRANAVLEDNATLLRSRIEQLGAEMAELRTMYEELARQLPPRVEYAPSPTAWGVLTAFDGGGVSQINDKRDVASLACPREAIEAAFDELCMAKVVELASVGEHGCWFRLTGYGRQFLTNYSMTRYRGTGAAARPTAGSPAIVANADGEADGRQETKEAHIHAVPTNLIAPCDVAVESPSRHSVTR